MRKILVVFNGVSYPAHVINYAMKLSADHSSLLHAVFMKPKHVDDTLQYPFPNDLSMTTDDVVDDKAEKRTDIQAIEDNKKVFIDECRLSNVSCTIDTENEILLDRLIQHSRFCDLIIADVKDDLGNYAVEDLLSRSECAVILVQRQSEVPGKIVLAYDGTATSFHAIKTYTYLLPEWRDVHTILAQVNPEDDDAHESAYMKDWLRAHFSKLEVRILHGEVEEQLTGLLVDSEKIMMVMGAYARKGLAGFFHKSLSDKMVSASHVSLFVAHQ
jgi:nucleotide-binding universal stress UspA family protein